MLQFTKAIICVMALSQSSADQTDGVPDRRCGLKCLYVCAKSMGQTSIDAKTLESWIGPHGPNGYSLAELEAQAQKLGFQTLGVKTTLDNLLSRSEPFTCITLVNNNHFVIVSDVNSKNVNVIDPPNEKIIPIDTFKSTWSGYVLIMSNSSIESEAIVENRIWRGKVIRLCIIVLIGVSVAIFAYIAFSHKKNFKSVHLCLLVFPLVVGCESKPHVNVSAIAPTGGKIGIPSTVMNLGGIQTYGLDKYKVVDIPITNLGDDQLLIKKLVLGCSCTSADIDNTRIPPKAVGILRIKLDIGHSAEERAAGVVIHSSDKNSPETRLNILWTAITPLYTEPRIIDFGRVDADEIETLKFNINIAGPAFCKDCNITGENNETRLQHEISLANHEFAADHSKTPTESGKNPVGYGEIKLKSDANSGTFASTVILRHSCKGAEYAQYALPIRWSVSPVLDVSPARISLGKCLPGNASVAKVLISHANNKPFKILKVECDDKNTKFKHMVKQVDEPGTTWQIEIIVSPKMSGGSWGSTIIIYTDEEKFNILKIPISAFE